MPFTDRFQLLDLKRDEGARTYEAREIATGRPVFVHMFSDPALLAQVDALPADERHRVLERGEHEAGAYIVTDRLAEYSGLREWLDAKCPQPPKPLDARGAWQFNPPVPPLTNSGEQTLKIPAPPAGDPGEFTRLFAKPVLRPTPPPAPPPAHDPGEFTRLFATPPPKPPPPQEPTPGEFTRQFQAPQRPAPPPPRAPVPPPASEAPGEFTQMLQAQRPSPAPAANNSSRSGEFARYFESPMSPSQASPNIATPVPPRPVSHARDAGEFTQIFGKDDLPSAPPPPAPAAPPPASNNATQVFAAPRAVPRAPISPPNIIVPAAGIPAGPGEYTQMFAKPSALTFGQPSAPQAPRPLPPLPARNNSRLPLLLVMGAAVLLVVAGIVYFMMRQHTT